MFGLRYLKPPPTTYVLQYRGGKLVREGAGLSFVYFSPASVIAQIPLASVGVPFGFNEVTADFQDATMQGELTYRVTDPKLLASILDFSVDHWGQYRSEDPQRLDDRLIHATQILTRAFTQVQPLRKLLVSGDQLVDQVLKGLRESEAVSMLGVEILGLTLLSLKATPEMAKALQAEARETLLQEADEAIYSRRNLAVELERQIKENELRTEIAVEQKRREVRETKLAADVAVEQARTELVDRQVENEAKESQARADAMRAVLEPIKDVDWRVLMATQNQLDAGQLIAMAFRDLADNADKVGSLNISPELLQSLVRPPQSELAEPPAPRRRNRGK